MGLDYIVMLAVIQGVTEFLPISSSAHLILPAQLLGLADQGLAFDVATHVGTLMAILFYFRRDFSLLTYAWLRSFRGGRSSQHSRLGWALVIGTIPAVLAGLAFNNLIEQHLRSTLVIAATTILFGLLLWFADAKRTESRKNRDLNLKDVLIIGCAQALALIPGTSRSGITITAGLMLGLTRQSAARFSFYLSAPLIMAAGAYKGLELYQNGDQAAWSAVLVGTAVAAISAYACIHWFLKILDRVGMLPFVIYRMILGATLLGLYWYL
ncbi:undecaprenyl-diphosphate phosphatase [Motiliproteus sp. MSK22-1]|uniref:undecaprenyl-diphosphate phosphatase n=1 Tax=Motiliproteus sp. MSK22-1 TaxID=1897630 RepID=UPI000977051D|nr:undecaprenyl-diphosphate phosphatase [Motiliproteus sp. MSK22-1]OMH30231.1 undecaprenyl-diphosphatase [Motiliproteus sp. MSK22-1]